LSACAKATLGNTITTHKKTAAVAAGKEIRMGSVILGKRAGREPEWLAQILIT
jgi:hypothetical protein